MGEVYLQRTGIAECPPAGAVEATEHRCASTKTRVDRFDSTKVGSIPLTIPQFALNQRSLLRAPRP